MSPSLGCPERGPDTGGVTISAFNVSALFHPAVPEAIEIVVLLEELGGTCSTHCHHQQRGLDVCFLWLSYALHILSYSFSTKSHVRPRALPDGSSNSASPSPHFNLSPISPTCPRLQLLSSRFRTHLSYTLYDYEPAPPELGQLSQGPELRNMSTSYFFFLVYCVYMYVNTCAIVCL